MTADILNHLTLNTGHICRLRRAEISDADIADLRPALCEALAGPVGLPVDLPGTPGYYLTTDATPGSCLTFDLRLNSNLEPLLTSWCARSGNMETHDRLWKQLREGQPTHAHPTRESRSELARWERLRDLRARNPVPMPATLEAPWLVTAELYSPLPYGQNVDHSRELDNCARRISWCWLEAVG